MNDFTIDVQGPGLDPGSYWLMDRLASGKRFQVGFEKYRQRALGGDRPQVVQEENAANEAMNLAQQTAELDEDQFQGVLGQLQQEMGSRPAPPSRPTVGPIGGQQALLAGIGALMFPQHAFKIGATPFQHAQRESELDYAEDLQQFDSDMAARKERIAFLGSRLEMLDKARRDSSERLAKLAEEARKRGDARRAQALEILKQLNSADDEFEIRHWSGILQSQYKDFPELVPNETQVQGQIDLILSKRQAEKEKTEGAKAAEAFDQETSLASGFLRILEGRYPQGHPIDADALKKIEAEANAYAENFPNFPNLKNRIMATARLGERPVSPAQDLARDRFAYGKGRDAEEDRKWEIKGRAEGWLEGPIGNPRPVVGYKDKGVRAKAQAAVDQQIVKAREATAKAMYHIAVPSPDEEKAAEESRDRTNKIWAALTFEWQKVMEKRAKFGGKRQPLSEYIQERYPEFAKELLGGASSVQPSSLTNVGTKAHKGSPPAQRGGYRQATVGGEKVYVRGG